MTSQNWVQATSRIPMSKSPIATLAFERIDELGFTAREFCQIFDLPYREFGSWVNGRQTVEPERKYFPRLAFALGISVQELADLYTEAPK